MILAFEHHNILMFLYADFELVKSICSDGCILINFLVSLKELLIQLFKK